MLAWVRRTSRAISSAGGVELRTWCMAFRKSSCEESCEAAPVSSDLEYGMSMPYFMVMQKVLCADVADNVA